MSSLRLSVPLTLAVLLCGIGLLAGQPPSFDKLSDADRAAFGQRFEREIWPLMERGGKDGCVGCHSKKGQVTALLLTGNAAKDFRTMLREGFLLKDDGGSVLARVATKDKKRRMPPDQRPGWTAAEIKILSDLINDLDAAQKK